MDDVELLALNNVLNYMLEVERKHWQETGMPQAHIYIDLRTLQKFAQSSGDEDEPETL